MRKWNRLLGCLSLGLNGDKTMCNSEPAEAMACQQARLQSTATASSDPPPPPSLYPLRLGGDVSSSQRPLRHSLDTCYFQAEEKVESSSLWFPSLFIFSLSFPVGCVVLVDLLQIFHTLSSTQHTRLKSSVRITESSLEDSSRRCAPVAAEPFESCLSKVVCWIKVTVPPVFKAKAAGCSYPLLTVSKLLITIHV